MIWFLEDHARLDQERKAVAALEARADWLKGVAWSLEATRLRVDADIEIGGTVYPFFLRYPDYYPDCPPSVFPREENQRWSSHQYLGSGELCLEWGPDTWHPGLTGADMIESAYTLLSAETPGQDQPAEPVASRHRATLGQGLRGKRNRFLVPPELQAFLARLPDATTASITVHALFCGERAFAAVTSVREQDGREWKSSDIPQAFQDLAIAYSGDLAIHRKDDSFLPSLDRETYVTALRNLGVVIEGTSARFVLEETSGGLRLGMLFNMETFPLLVYKAVSTTNDDVPRVDPSYAGFGSTSVGIVGCGSVGSKVASSLARDGVGRFVLVDDDVFLSENLCRNDLDWLAMGDHKVDAVAQRIGLISGTANVEVRRVRLVGQEANQSIAGAISALAACDILIDATASGETFNRLAGVVRQAKKPLVWMEVFAGGIGGLVARHRPGLDPDPQTMRQQFLAWCEEMGVQWDRQAVDYSTANGEGGIMVADDAAVTLIAANATRFASDILSGRQPSCFPFSMYVIGLSKEWIFTQPFDTYPIDVGSPPAEEPLDDRAAEIIEGGCRFIGELLERARTQDPSTT